MRSAQEFIEDVAGRLANRVRLTTDGCRLYLEAAENAFGDGIDDARLVEFFGAKGKGGPEKRYSSARFVQAQCGFVTGDPVRKYVSTNYVEPQNLTMRMSMRRSTRLTKGFSKKVENHMHAISLHFMHYNFCRIHKSLKATPAMEAGIADTVYELDFVVDLIDDREAAKLEKRGPYRKRTPATSN